MYLPRVRFKFIYCSADLLFLDDPLAALDMHVADKIMSQAICGELKDKTRIIVTNAIQHLKYADRILVIDSGRITFDGDYESIQKNEI